MIHSQHAITQKNRSTYYQIIHPFTEAQILQRNTTLLERNISTMQKQDLLLKQFALTTPSSC